MSLSFDLRFDPKKDPAAVIRSAKKSDRPYKTVVRLIWRSGYPWLVATNDIVLTAVKVESADLQMFNRHIDYYFSVDDIDHARENGGVIQVEDLVVVGTGSQIANTKISYPNVDSLISSTSRTRENLLDEKEKESSPAIFDFKQLEKVMKALGAKNFLTHQAYVDYPVWIEPHYNKSETRYGVEDESFGIIEPIRKY